MLISSIENAQEDVSARMVIEARSEGEQLVYTAERFIEKNKSFLSTEEIEKTTTYIQALKDVLSSGNKDLILEKTEALNEFTRPFAERVMDAAVSQAMKGKSLN